MTRRSKVQKKTLGSGPPFGPHVCRGQAESRLFSEEDALLTHFMGLVTEITLHAFAATIPQFLLSNKHVSERKVHLNVKTAF